MVSKSQKVSAMQAGQDCSTTTDGARMRDRHIPDLRNGWEYSARTGVQGSVNGKNWELTTCSSHALASPAKHGKSLLEIQKLDFFSIRKRTRFKYLGGSGFSNSISSSGPMEVAMGCSSTGKPSW